MIQIDKDPLSPSRHVHPESLKSNRSVPQVGMILNELMSERDHHFIAYIYQQPTINSALLCIKQLRFVRHN